MYNVHVWLTRISFASNLPKMTWISVASEVDKVSDLTKSTLIEDILLPESKRASCHV